MIDLEIVEEQQQHLLSLSQPQLFLAIAQQEGSCWCFLPTPQPAQLLHSFPFLQFVLDRPKLLIYILHLHVPEQGYVTEIKTPPIWLQAQADLRLYIKSTDIIYLGCDCMKTH